VLNRRASHILPILYLHDTSITPNPSHRAQVGRGSKVDLDGSFTCWPHTTYLLPYTLVVPVTHYPAPTHPSGGGGRVQLVRSVASGQSLTVMAVHLGYAAILDDQIQSWMPAATARTTEGEPPSSVHTGP
jgi:hypothetical protein